MSDQPPRTLVRPGGGEGAARLSYDRARAAELKRERAQLRAAELEAMRRKLDRLDLEIAGLAAIQARELAVDLQRSGFDTTGFRPVPLPTQLELDARRGRGRPPDDPMLRARQEAAADRGRLVRTYITRITVR